MVGHRWQWIMLLGLLVGMPGQRVYSGGQASRLTPVEHRIPGSDSGVDTLVLCPEEFQPTLVRWVDYRTEQGYRISVQTPARNAFEIRQQVQAAAEAGTLKHLLIVGDAGDLDVPARHKVVTDYVMAKVNVLFGSEPEIATDHTYSDLDNNGIPDLTLGRIPVDSTAELRQFIDRIIEFERTAPKSDWLHRFNFVAGVGGFGKLIDGIIEETTKQVISDLLPGGIRTTMTYGSWSSPYCPDPRRFSEEAIERFNEGCLFWVYIGHGAARQLDHIYLPDQHHRILDAENVTQINCRHGSPIAVFLSCYSGAVDGQRDGLAELMLQQPRGPVAVVAGTRVTMPAAMGLLSLEMMHEYFEGRAETLGEIFLLAKQRMVEGSDNFPQYREMIEGLAQTFNGGMAFKREKLEHVHLLHLLGDPLLRVPRPKAIYLATSERVSTGEKLVISGNTQQAGKLVLELCCQRDRLRERFPRRRQYIGNDEKFREYQQVYDRNRDLVLHSRTLDVPSGLFRAEIQVPRGWTGPGVIRARMVTEEGFALGSIPVTLEKPKKVEQPLTSVSTARLQDSDRNRK